jgi:hypothetical protein
VTGEPPKGLVGTWRLVDWTVSVGDRSRRPWGGNASGLLTYTDDGRMWAALMATDRPEMPTRTLSAAPPTMRAAAASGFVTYAGSYTIDGDDVIHHVEISLLPNYVGNDERRHVDWVETAHGLDLELTTPPTDTDGGRVVVERLQWERISPGEDAS